MESASSARLDAGGFVSCTSPQSYPGPLAEGSHTFTVVATDAAGNTSLPASYTWSIDTTAPDTVIDSGPTSPTSSTSASFTFHSTETGSSFLCSLDGVTPAPCASPTAYSSLAQGSHSFQVAASDAAGNTDASAATFSWTIDLTGPDVTINSVPPNPTNQTSASFGFQSADPTATFECQLDTGGFSACTSTQFYPGPLSEGPHTFYVRARDLAGNVSSPASFTWVVDLTAPSTTIETAPPAYTTSNSATFTFVGSESGTYLCQLDGVGNFESCSPSGQTYSGLAQGSHTFRVEETDAAGNTGSPTSYSWAVDSTAPDTTITAGPANGSSTSSTSASFSFTGTDNISLPGNLTFECQLDGGSFSTCTSSISYSSLTAGSHTFAVRAKDQAGNTDATPDTRTWTVDTTAPDTTITGGPANASTSGPSVSFSFSSNETGTFECKLDGGSFASCTSPKTYSGLTDGSHTFAVRAVDQAGNTDATPDSRTWTVDATGPVTTISSPTSGSTTGPSVSVTFSANETATFQCKLDGGAYAGCTSPQPYGGLSSGSHTVSVKGTDSYGNIGAVASVTWTVDATAPNTTITSSPPNPSSSSSASFSFTSSEPGSTFECKLDAAAFTSCGSPQVYSSLADGSHTFSVRATDAYGNTDATPATFTWTVNATAPPAPTITSKPPNPSNDSSPSFSFTDTEAGVTFQCSLDGSADSKCTSPKSYRSLADGSHTFMVKAKDAAGNLSPATSYTWTVDRTAPPVPTITSKPPNPSNNSSPSFSFTDTEAGVTFQCKLDAGSYVSCTSPQNYAGPVSAGSHTFSVTATDAAGNTSSAASYTWTIETTPPTVTINQASGQADPTSVSPINFTVVFSESVTDFATGDVTLSGTAGATTATVTGSGTTYNVAVSGMTSNGTVIASLAAGVAHDAAGNANSASTSTDNTVTVTSPSAPSITSFSPTSGPVGTSVIINGANFTGATAVAFNGVSATYNVNTSIKITATVPAGATTGLISVTTPAGTGTSTGNFTVQPRITSFTPTSGAVGDGVTITGTTFTGTTSVKFNGTSAPFTFNSDTQITASVPAGATTGPISVTTPGGTATSASNFTVGPWITTFSPTSGPVGTSVTINGANFTGATAVTFNGVSATYNVNSSTRITATVPAGAATGLIRVTTSAGSGSSTGNFIVKPGITSFAPMGGAVGTSVTITGTTFTGTTSVKFNGTVGHSFTFNSDTQITTTVPPGATTGPISVTTPAGTATSASNFTLAPLITSFSPTSGLVGTSVIINGSDFTGATAVTFNGVSATFTVNSSTKITATVPAGATTGLIRVTTPAGTGSSTGNFAVQPRIASFTPMSGAVGASVTITGATFTGTTSVKFNGTSAAFTVVSDTQITATVPSDATTGSISVTTPGGTATSAVIFFVTPGTIGIDATVFTDGSGTMTTPQFSTSTTGDLLIAFVAYDGPSGSQQTASVTGAGLTWALVQRGNSQAGTAEIWSARATGSLSGVTVVSRPGTGSYHGSLTVIAFSNASGIGSTGSASGLSGAPDIPLSVASAGNWVFAVGNDWDHAIDRIPVSGQVLVHQWKDTGVNDTYWVQSTAAPSISPGLVDIHDSSPTTDRWNYAAVEIIATHP